MDKGRRILSEEIVFRNIKNRKKKNDPFLSRKYKITSKLGRDNQFLKMGFNTLASFNIFRNTIQKFTSSYQIYKGKTGFPFN